MRTRGTQKQTFLCMSVMDSGLPAGLLVPLYKEMKFSRKGPLREKNILLFVSDERKKKKPLQTLAGSDGVCYHFCWWLGMISQGTMSSIGALQMLCTESICSLFAATWSKQLSHNVWRVINYSADICHTGQQHQHTGMPSESWSEWSENGFSALEALFRGRGALWVSWRAGFLWVMFWAAHRWRRGGTQSTAALKMYVLVVPFPWTANDALGHHLATWKQRQRERGLGKLFMLLLPLPPWRKLSLKP